MPFGFSYRLAAGPFMAHRIRESMRELNPSPVGGEGKYVEADETYIGGKERNKHRSKRTKGNIGEFDFRYNERAKLGVDDNQRMVRAVKGIEGKRLTYRRTDEAPNA